ncbi:unnamed protein product [Rotaria socialis]|uniref:Xylulose kinase n=1 Tax=Rotaria socialis TaxID=392032 RepID=A0A820GLS4_9BILA|nr:unnamed protein product [Rotaria socialis]CAF4281405.1 unnamed protein product [Rotaria socialis]CAF4480016.1 unnamed protein product [Rotaria socialis]
MSNENVAQRLYLGIDLSTQQIKCIVIDEQLQTIAEEAISFNDKSLLVHHVQPNGFVVDKNDKRCITTPVFVFLEALDVALQKLSDQKKFDFSNIVGISGCGQQHGSVYWKTNTELGSLKADTNREQSLSLVNMLKSSFSRIDCPIWMDSSTTNECQSIEKSVGGSQNLFQITGSKAYERFTGSQIMKVANKTPEIYEQTERIQLISNFVTSILLGEYAPIDLSDGSGMNLLDIRQCKWSNACLDICGKDLERKLSEKLVHPRTALGNVANYFVERYGFNSQCQIVSFTGDNPSSYYALASDPKTIVISLAELKICLGTSDTVMGAISANEMPKQALDGHLLVNPLANDRDNTLLMLLLCFKNGSLVRERVREETGSKDWHEMSVLLSQTTPSNQGFIGFFYDDHEILPQNIQGRFYFNADNQTVENLEAATKARAVLEGQCLAKRLYLQRANIDLTKNVDRIVITGGASVNVDLVQILADIFGKPVYAAVAPNSGALGGALRAVDVITEKSNSTTSSVECLIAAQPRSQYTAVYDEMLLRYTKLEEKIIQDGK